MGKDIIIRGYSAGDRERVQDICIATGPEQARQNAAFANLLLAAFCNYYIEFEPHNCFVADDEGVAVGYILCAEDSRGWSEVFQEKFMPESEAAKGMFMGIMSSPLKYADEYPAHLHIDISPDYQRMGIGTRLMDALMEHLEKSGVRGVMFGVSPDNTGAISFYKRYGFEVLEQLPQEVVMGRKVGC